MVEERSPRSLAAGEVKRYRLTLAYDGTLFHGWQKQRPPGRAPLRTVAGVVEEALARLLRQPISLRGASRTDAGVHALGQAAVFDAASPIPLERMREAITSRLPVDIDVLAVEVVAPDFDFVRDVVTKRYRYRLFCCERRPLERRHYTWHCWAPLDIERMRDAAARLVGEHDFAGFAAAGHGRETTLRTVHRCDIERDEPEVHLVVEGSGFLYNMVRIIAGSLIDVGRGRLDAGCVQRALASGDREELGATAPPDGLYLLRVRYRDRPFRGADRGRKGVPGLFQS